MKDKIKINLETGLMVDIVHPSVFGDDIIETPCDYPFHLPKWNGETWVEGATQEYIDSLQSEVPTQTLNLEEKVLEHEEKIVTLEETLDVLFGGAE